MKANTYDLRTILTLDRRFLIPTFQRDYEWTEKEQWDLLFDDLEDVAGRLEDARLNPKKGMKTTSEEQQVAPHFLGAVVLQDLPSSVGSPDLRSVIDGQQRITTIQLLIRGILDVLQEMNSASVPRVRRLINNPSDVIKVDDERHKLWPRRRDREVWRLAMSDSIPAAGEHLYLKARRFFKKRADEAIRVEGKDRSDVVVDALISLFKVVVIDLESNDDAQVIFEVLNGRQTPLSATDLVKNLLFLRAEISNEADLENLYDRYWAPFDDPWWRERIGIGHAARGRRDVLLSSWLTVTTGSEVNVEHLYAEVRHYLEDREPAIEDVLRELQQSAAEFRVISDRPAGLPERLAEAYKRIEELNVTTALPLLTWLRTLREGELSAQDQLEAVVALESWIVRRIITGFSTRGYGKRFVEVLRSGQEAAASGASVAEAIKRSLVDGGALQYSWPTDAEVEKAFLERVSYASISKERLRMLLGAIDKQMHAEHAKGQRPTFNYDTLHIEHILPQAWATNWPVGGDDPVKRQLQEQEREQAKHRIGNLTLVTEPLNIEVSNGAWSVKRAALAEHDNLRLCAELKNLETWDEKAISARARRLAAVGCRVWPRPAI